MIKSWLALFGVILASHILSFWRQRNSKECRSTLSSNSLCLLTLEWHFTQSFS